jgi:hypothetical protein
VYDGKRLGHTGLNVSRANATIANIATDIAVFGPIGLPDGCGERAFMFTPEMQWQSRGQRRISQGVQWETLGAGCSYPGDRASVDSFVNNTNRDGLRPFVGNLSFCADGEAQEKLLNPPQPDISWWTVWYVPPAPEFLEDHLQLPRCTQNGLSEQSSAEQNADCRRIYAVHVDGH